PYSQSGLRFDFAAPFYDDSEGVEYQTMLEGRQTSWSAWSKESWRDLSNLWEGRYRLHVRARNSYGQSSNEATYAFRVLPPWYRTWWAYMLYAVAAFGVTSGLLKWRLYQLRERNLKLEAIVEERTVEIRHQRDQIKEQEEKSEALLLNILPAPVAKELLETGAVEPMLFDDVTVCFIDFVGFTVSSETLEAREVVAQLDKYFTEFDRIVTRYGMEKLKTIGDAYMFVSGLPQQSNSHAVDAVLAALEILEKAKELASRPGGTGWRLRIGLHSGPVVAGVVGVRKFAFDIWGDTVNLASRMESSGSPNRVNLSARTYSLVKEFIECEARGLVHTKDGRDLEMFFAQRMHLAGAAGIDIKEFQPAYERQYQDAFGRAPKALPRDAVREVLLPASYK
ncbi:MAG: adenylate/guanylate cyclase domain-containing protein, partial [Acidobacteriota bacterium]